MATRQQNEAAGAGLVTCVCHLPVQKLASTTPGLLNASVEFDLATLQPTYRLLCGTAGESNALSVAEGLGFNRAVVQEAREVAARLRQQQALPDRGRQLKESLQEQVGEAKAAAAGAAAARASAEGSLAASQQQLQELRQQVADSRPSGDHKAAAGQARSQVQRVLADVRAGRVTAQEAEARLRSLEQQARAASAATALAGLGGDEAGGEAAALAPAPEGWLPRAGDAVRVLKMGGCLGTVVADRAGAGRLGSKLSVRVGTITVELRVGDLVPGGSGSTRPSKASKSPLGSGQARAGSVHLAAGAAAASGGQVGTGTLCATAGVALQTAQNTVDVRGLTADEAEGAVADAVGAAGPGWVLYVVHGVGTGRVRTAVQALLRRGRLAARVASAEEEERSNGGCTVVRLRE